MNKLLLILFIFLLSFNIVNARWFAPEIPPGPSLYQINIEINNSFYNQSVCRAGFDCYVENLYVNKNITFFGEIINITVVNENITGELNIDANLSIEIISGDGSVLLQSELNHDACILLRESPTSGFDICNDGSGTDTFRIRNIDGQDYITIDKDTDIIGIHNVTIFYDNVSVQNNLDMSGTNISNVLKTVYDVTGCEEDAVEGTVCWNSEKKTLNIVTGLGNIIQVSQELSKTVRNLEGATIYAGDIVSITGSSGEIETAVLANNTDGNLIHNLAMVTVPSCNNNALCIVTSLGEVHDLNTLGLTEGEPLYLNASGGYTNIKEVYPFYNIHIGEVTRIHATTGIIDFHPEVDYGDGVIINSLGIITNLTVGGLIHGGYIDRYDYGNFIGSLYINNSISTLSLSNSLLQVMSDTRGTPQFQIQDGGANQASFIVRSFLVVNQNNSLLNSSQNNICGDWGFSEIDCNTATTGADFGVTDDIESLGLIYTKSGLRTYVDRQSAFLVASENITSKYNGTNGIYDADTNIFCDYSSNNFDTTGGWININDIASIYEGTWADINTFINSSCIELKNNPSWITSFNNIDWRVTNNPELAYLKKGFGEYYIGDSDRSGFKFKIKNGTGSASIIIDDTVGARTHRAFDIEQNMYGFSSIAQSIYMYSSKQLVDKDLTMLLMTGDASNMNSSNGVFIDMNIIGQPLTNDGHLDGIHMPQGLTHLIEVGASSIVNSVYYEATNITGYTTNSSTIQIFTNDNDVLYVGNTLNFTNIGITLSTPSSANIASLYYYCNSTEEWAPLTGVTSTTNGFISSGIISFTNPSNRGKCNTELDGTPFSDTTKYTYIAIQRTRNFIVTPPVLDLLTISGSSTYMFLSELMLRLSPTDSAPELCTASNKGAIYFDISEDDMCVCKSTGWKVLSSGVDCT